MINLGIVSGKLEKRAMCMSVDNIVQKGKQSADINALSKNRKQFEMCIIAWSRGGLPVRRTNWYYNPYFRIILASG